MSDTAIAPTQITRRLDTGRLTLSDDGSVAMEKDDGDLLLALTPAEVFDLAELLRSPGAATILRRSFMLRQTAKK